MSNHECNISESVDISVRSLSSPSGPTPSPLSSVGPSEEAQQLLENSRLRSSILSGPALIVQVASEFDNRHGSTPDPPSSPPIGRSIAQGDLKACNQLQPEPILLSSDLSEIPYIQQAVKSQVYIDTQVAIGSPT